MAEDRKSTGIVIDNIGTIGSIGAGVIDVGRPIIHNVGVDPLS